MPKVFITKIFPNSIFISYKMDFACPWKCWWHVPSCVRVRNLLGPLANLLIRLANYSNSLRILIKKQLRSLLLVNLDLAQSFQAFMNYDLCIPFLIMIFLHIYSIVQSSVVIHTREQEWEIIVSLSSASKIMILCCEFLMQCNCFETIKP